MRFLFRPGPAAAYDEAPQRKTAVEKKLRETAKSRFPQLERGRF